MLMLAWDIDFLKEYPYVLTPCHAYVTLGITKINIVEKILRI